MVKSRGYRIELAEIEQAICSHPPVSAAAAIAIPDLLIGNKIIAYVSVKDGESIESAVLVDFCQARLPKYMIPEIFEFRASLPMTSSGKIDRKTLANEAISKYGATG
jgi:acyl-coenzyme A synthetase/AMP-(fatty) acid ligase